MARTTYQVTLYASGKHSVSVTSDEAAALKPALAWARGTLERLMVSGEPQPERVGDEEIEVEEVVEEVPVCAVHNLPMTKQKGRFGTFWSCHQRNEDGSFCSYRPDSK